MSAWVVSENHIRVLVESLYRYEAVNGSTQRSLPTPDEVGQRLWKENHRSVNYRYQERKRTPQYRHDSNAYCTDEHGTSWGAVFEMTRQPAVVLKLVTCYSYQTCERPDWEQSVAHTQMQRLCIFLCKAMRCTEEAARAHATYVTAPWRVF